MNYTIYPLKGVGDFEFGMPVEAVRARMKMEFRSFKRTPQSVFPCDYFPSESAFFYYDASGRLAAIEFAAPARPTINGLDLLSLTFGQAIAKLAALDEHVETDAAGAIAYQLGVSIYVPEAKDGDDAPVESVLAFRQGYYD